MIKLAESGDADAQLALGNKLREGVYTEKDETASVEWFRKAASQGNVIAQHELGIAYRYGYGATEDPFVARKWFETAAERGGCTENLNPHIMMMKAAKDRA